MTLARLVLSLALSLAAVPALAQSGPPPGGGATRGPAKVGVMLLEQAEVPRRSVLPGRAIASQEARIRPRVTGMVTEILYTPGQRLETGTPMFRLDDSTLQAEVESARASVARAQAA
ncbi:MAG TPA: biotin/lipoyl-binding protein, partial [Gemmobacter sp.]|nr:biotin/lipoyl-binding protein [Gemmobacter sp.]